MTKKGLNRLIFAVILGIFIITGFVLYYAMTMQAPADGYAAHNGHEARAYEKDIRALEEAVHMTEEHVKEEIREHKNIFAAPENGHDAPADAMSGHESEAGAVMEEEHQSMTDHPVELPSEPVEMVYECDFDAWVGEMVTGLELDTFARPYRVLEPGAMYTTDHVPERINIHVDEHGEVVGVTCG